jgi:hypothetical protein
MFASLKQRLEEFAKDEPGTRFQDRYHRIHAGGRNIVHKAFFITLGAFVIGAGIFFLPAPGPGMLIIAFGAALIAQESLALARLMDRAELKGREWHKVIKPKWDASWALRVAVLGGLAVLGASVMYLSYRFFSR